MGINFHGGGTDRLIEQPLPESVTPIDVFLAFTSQLCYKCTKEKNFSAALIDVLSASITAPLYPKVLLAHQN